MFHLFKDSEWIHMDPSRLTGYPGKDAYPVEHNISVVPLAEADSICGTKKRWAQVSPRCFLLIQAIHLELFTSFCFALQNEYVRLFFIAVVVMKA